MSSLHWKVAPATPELKLNLTLALLLLVLTVFFGCEPRVVSGSGAESVDRDAAQQVEVAFTMDRCH